MKLKSRSITIICSLLLYLTSFTVIAEQSVTTSLDSPPTKVENDVISYIQAPENRKQAKSRDIEVAYVRFQGLSKGIPLFVVLGGPGDTIQKPSLDYWKDDIEPYLSIGDVVIAEQREVGASKPNLTCGNNPWPLNKPMTGESTLKYMRNVIKQCVSRWESSGVDFRGYNQEEIAQDVDSIREHLGFNKINITGGSYGSAVAYQYVRGFPGRVNQSILTQLLAPNSTFHQPGTINTYVTKLGDITTRSRIFPIPSELTVLIQNTINKVKKEPVHAMFDEKVILGAFDIQLITTLA